MLQSKVGERYNLFQIFEVQKILSILNTGRFLCHLRIEISSNRFFIPVKLETKLRSQKLQGTYHELNALHVSIAV